jgi:hypothetical protein
MDRGVNFLNMISKRKIYLGCLLLSFLLLCTACQPNAKPSAIIAQGTVDINGTKQTISIWMVEGKEINDSEPGPFQGTFLNGSFEVVATDQEGKELARFGLNEAFDGGELRFRKEPPFKLLFDDYNEDGQPDFTVGQWGGSNGNIYTLITIGSNGFRVLEKSIYSADHQPSIRYRKLAGKAFLNKYYDQIIGADMDVIHRWKDGAFYKDIPIKSKEPGAAVLFLIPLHFGYALGDLLFRMFGFSPSPYSRVTLAMPFLAKQVNGNSLYAGTSNDIEVVIALP